MSPELRAGIKVTVPVLCALSVICKSRKSGVPSLIYTQLPMRASSRNCDRSGVSTSVVVEPVPEVPSMKGRPSCCTVSCLSCVRVLAIYLTL